MAVSLEHLDFNLVQPLIKINRRILKFPLAEIGMILTLKCQLQFFIFPKLKKGPLFVSFMGRILVYRRVQKQGASS